MEEFFQQLVNGIVLGSIYSLIAVGLSQIFGVLHIIQWAHGEVYMIGAFVCFFLVTKIGVPYFIAMILVIIIMGFFGAIIERIVFNRLRKLGIMSTVLGAIGLSIFLLNMGQVIFSPEPKRFYIPFLDKPLQFGVINLTVNRLVILVMGFILIMLLSWFIRKNIIGRAMLAVEQDTVAASLMGINIDYIARVAFVIGSAYAGAAGCLIGPLFLIYPKMSAMAVSKAFPVVILGGLGNIEGAIVGGFIIGIVESLTAAYISSAYKEIAAFVILILVLYFKPEGIFGRKVMEKV
ncbi:High-affinity branched-chain amino acid transport system permease protein LivH [subsurface metagenome]